MSNPHMIIVPERPALVAGHDNTVNVLVRVQAPDMPEETPPRPPLNLALVIDRSGSMSGRPLHEAMRCAEMIVDKLDAGDGISLVTYDHRTSVVIPYRTVADRRGLKSAIREICAGGMTALYDGWHQGAGQASFGVDRSGVTRVLLLSDGQANEGLTEPDEIAKRCGQMAEVGVTTSTYGLSDHFNEELMVQMARSGLGNSYYGQTAEDLMDPFLEEFELLQALCARNLTLRLTTPDGTSCEVLNGYPEAGTGTWKLPDLAYGGEAWAAVKLRVPLTATGPGRKNEQDIILKADLSYSDLDGSQHRLEERTLSLPSLPPGAFASLAADPIVEKRFQEINAARLQEQARDAAHRGDWERVDQLLAQATKQAHNNPWLQEQIQALNEYAKQRRTQTFRKEVMYSRRNLTSRLADVNEASGGFSDTEESQKARYLRRRREQGKRNM